MDAQALQTLLDKQQLQELVRTYCRAIDRRDFDVLMSLYHPDSTDDHGGMFQGSGPDYVRWVPSILARFEATDHLILSDLYTVEGDVAEGEVHILAYHRSHPPNAREIITNGRYLDRYEKRDGVWRFAHRSLVYDWHTRRTHDVADAERTSKGSEKGQAGETDPLYQRMRLIQRGKAPPWC